MDLQKMTPCPLANCRTSAPRLVTDIQCICTPYKQKRTHKHPAVGGHHVASEMFSRCHAPCNTNIASSSHEERTQTTRGVAPLNTPYTTCKDLLPLTPDRISSFRTHHVIWQASILVTSRKNNP